MARNTFFVPSPPDPKMAVLSVFELSHDRADELALSLAVRFGLKGDVHKEDDTHVIADGDRFLAVYPQTGAFLYFDFGKFDNPVENVELPDARAAERQALAYLREREWLPEDFDLDRVSVGLREIISDGERGTNDTYVCVSFRPRYGGIEGYGPGGKINVFLGHKGEVIGLLRAAAVPRVHAKYPILPAEEVRKKLERKIGQAVDTLKLTEAKLVYHAESMVVATRFMQPAYLFEFESDVSSGKNGGAVGVPFEVKPFPATRFAPLAFISSNQRDKRIQRGDAYAFVAT
jgi:hypothetical protein